MAAEFRENIVLPAGRYTRLTVRDTGPTMDSLAGARLVTSRGIVAKFGGHISVESETGRGTAFRIYLPASVDCGSDA
jgi:signal transduction histidine kinase